MTEQTPAPEGARIGTVAEETARLVEAFAVWSTTQRSARAAGDQDEDRDGHGSASHEGESPRGYAGRPGAPGPSVPVGGEAGPRCESCGAENGVGRAASCGVCPLCQGISWLRTVHPETLERIADVAGMLTETLREVARQARPAPRGPEDETSDPTPGRGASVQHIPVEDDEDDEPVVGHDRGTSDTQETHDTHDTGKRTRQ